MRDNWRWGGAAPGLEGGSRELTQRKKATEREGGSSMETHKPSSLAGAGYNATQKD